MNCTKTLPSFETLAGVVKRDQTMNPGVVFLENFFFSGSSSTGNGLDQNLFKTKHQTKGIIRHYTRALQCQNSDENHYAFDAFKSALPITVGK